MKKVLFLSALLTLLFTGYALAGEFTVGAGGDCATLTEALAQASDGDTLRLLSGEHLESEENYPIVVEKSVAIVGEEGAVLAGVPFQSILEITAENVRIENVRFELLRYGIKNLADGLTVENCDFALADETYRVSSCGLWLAGAYNCTVRDCDFTGCGMCVAGPPLSERSSAMPVLTGLFEVGEDTALFTSHTIQGNTVNGKPYYFIINQDGAVVPADAGGALVACCEGVLCEGLDVSESSMGVQIVHSSDVILRNCVADRCGVFGIYLAYIDGGRLENISCRQSNHAIDLRDVQSLVVTGCETVDSEQGIFLSWAFDTIVEKCAVTNCGFGYFAAVGEGNVLTDCVFTGNETGVYLQNEADALVWDNDITGSGAAGVRVLKSPCHLLDNRIHDNWVGVLAAETAPMTMLGNALEGNVSTALYMHQITRGVIAGNTFSGENPFLELDEAVSHTLVENNVFEGTMAQVVSNLSAPLDLSHNQWAG